MSGEDRRGENAKPEMLAQMKNHFNFIMKIKNLFVLGKYDSP